VIAFPEIFIRVLVYVALAWTVLGAVALLALLLKDFKDKNLW